MLEITHQLWLRKFLSLSRLSFSDILRQELDWVFILSYSRHLSTIDHESSDHVKNLFYKTNEKFMEERKYRSILRDRIVHT